MADKILMGIPKYPINPKPQTRLIADVITGKTRARPLRRNSTMVTVRTPRDNGASKLRSDIRPVSVSAFTRGGPT